MVGALMVAGGWVEGLYIASQVCLVHNTPELRQRIAEQKLPLADLISLINTYGTTDQGVNSVLADLKALEPLFANVTVGGGGSNVTQEGGVTVIGGSAPAASITDEQVKAIAEKTTAIRNTYIN